MRDDNVFLGWYKHRGGASRQVTEVTDEIVRYTAGPQPRGRGRFLPEGTVHKIKKDSFLLWTQDCTEKPKP